MLETEKVFEISIVGLDKCYNMTMLLTNKRQLQRQHTHISLEQSAFSQF